MGRASGKFGRGAMHRVWNGEGAGFSVGGVGV